MRTPAEQLLALEAQGVTWSRNKNFALFEQEGPRRARKLRRLLDAVAEIIHAHTGDELEVEVASVEGPRPVELRLKVDSSSTFAVRLSRDELGILLQDPVVADTLVKAGLSANEAQRT